MKLYELYLILKPGLNEAEVEKIGAEAAGPWAKNGFEVTGSKVSPHERLPYPIKHFGEGHILDMELSGPEEAAFPQEITAALGRNENILRHLVLAKSEKIMKKIKPLPAFEQRFTRSERKPTAAETAPLTEPKPEKPVDIEEVDRKLEELLK